MNSELLIKLGLTKSQAQTYIALVRGGELSPAQLAKQTGESRTAAYAALDKLVEIGLANENQESKTKRYVAASPAELERFIEQQRKQLDATVVQAERNKMQADIDRQQSVRDRAQAEKDRQQAELDSQQAERDRIQAEKDRHQAQLDRVQADKDRQQAEKDRAQAEIERLHRSAKSLAGAQE